MSDTRMPRYVIAFVSLIVVLAAASVVLASLGQEEDTRSPGFDLYSCSEHPEECWG